MLPFQRKIRQQHHDQLQLTIPLARQQGAGPQFGSGSVEVSDEPVDPVQRLRPDPIEQPPTVSIEVAEPVGLQPVRQNTKQQVAGGDEAAPAAGTPCAIWLAGPRDRDRAVARSRSQGPLSPPSRSARAAWRSTRATTSTGSAAVLDDTINPVTVATLRAKIEAELLAHHTGEKATYRMLLPMGRPHDGGNGRSLRSVQHREHASLLRARPAAVERASLSLRLTGAMPLASRLSA